MTPSAEERLNGYLAAEWGYEGEVTTDSPFALRRLGEIDGSTIYEFSTATAACSRSMAGR